MSQPNNSPGRKQVPLSGRVSVKVDIDASLDRAVELKAAALDIPKRQVVEDAIRLYIESQGRAA